MDCNMGRRASRSPLTAIGVIPISNNCLASRGGAAAAPTQDAAEGAVQSWLSASRERIQSISPHIEGRRCQTPLALMCKSM